MLLFILSPYYIFIMAYVAETISSTLCSLRYIFNVISTTSISRHIKVPMFTVSLAPHVHYGMFSWCDQSYMFIMTYVVHVISSTCLLWDMFLVLISTTCLLHRSTKLTQLFVLKQNHLFLYNFGSLSPNPESVFFHHVRILQYCQFHGCQVWKLVFPVFRKNYGRYRKSNLI